MSDDLKFEIGHVLFIDIVGYSKLLIEEQKERLAQLTKIVLGTAQVRESTDEQLVRLPTGDGMALVFRHSAEEPARCALEIAEALRKHPEISVRMGIHSGPVSEVTDVSGRTNIAGAGINMAQRVMDCGDAGHILLSQHVADDLVQYRQWAPRLRDLGECEVKHGVRLRLVNLYAEPLGNPEPPEKFRQVVTSASTSSPVVKPRRMPWHEVAVVAVLLAVLIGAGFFFFRQRTTPQTTSAPTSRSGAALEKSIAVLPFENLSSDKENAYFAEGIQDEILTRLAKIGALKVISRTSTAHFASSPQNLPEIAHQLGVANILEGSVQKAHDTVHVNVQLIKAATDDHLWAESYDRKLDDIFGVEKEVAQNIAAALNAKLTGTEQEALGQRPTNNSSAYEAYLRGNTQFWEVNEQSLLAAEKSYKEAVTADPQFARAWAALARLDAIRYLVNDTTLARRAAAEQSLREAERLDPNAAETAEARGYFAYLVQHDLKGTVNLMEQAHQRWPNNAEVLQLLSFAAARLGEWNKAADALDNAIVLNPRDLVTRKWAVSNGVDRRDFTAARRLADEALQFWPDEANLLGLKAETYQAEGQLDEAQALISRINPRLRDYDAINAIWYQAKLRRDPAPAMKILGPLAHPTESGSDWINNAAEVADLQALAGDKAASQATFREVRDRMAPLVREQPENVRFLSSLAQALSYLGEKDAALQIIDKAMKLRAGDLRNQSSTEEQRARILALFGDKDEAIDILQRLLRTRYSGWAAAPVTPALLRLDPDFDQLRKDPRFEKLCQEK